MSISARKRSYTGRKAETGLAQSTSLYAYCFNILLNKLFKTVEEAPHTHEGGLAFVLEAGNRNDDDVSRLFYKIRSLHGLENRLNSITFAKKQRGPAIQIADFLAFYSRRHAVECEKHQEPVPTRGILDQIARSVPHYGLVVTDFYP